MAPPRLGNVMHCTVDRMHEDLLELQTACCTSSDSDRRKKIILYCELQRHRALQLLALHHFAEKESAVVEAALQGVDRELLVQWQKNAAAWNPEYAREDMRPYAAWEAVKLFKSVRAPKYDVKTAVNVLVNQQFSGGGGGFELLEKNMMEEEEPSAAELQDRVLARVLAQELHSCGGGRDGFPAPVDGQITCQSEAYVVKLTLDDKSTWYCTSMRIYVAQPGSEDKLHLSPRWGDILADQLEAFIAKQQPQSNVFDATHKFMTTFCGSLALQILERQAGKLAGVQVHTSTVDTLKLALAVPGWFLVIQIEGSKFSCKIECEGSTNQVLEVSISLRNLCLVAVLGSAMSQVSKHKLRALREQVLASSTRHDASQCRIVTKSEQQHETTVEAYQLDLDLFDDSTVLSIRFTEGAFVFSTNSRAVRWGQFTVDEFLGHRAKDVAGDGERAAGVVLALWAEAEAWDCLSLLSNAIQGVYSAPSYVSPSFELVPHLSPLPSLFWSLGSFEGLKYVLVCQFKQSPSLFHLKFLPKHKRLLGSVECMVCSIGKGESSGEVGVLDLKREPLETLLVQQQESVRQEEEEEGGMDALSALLLEMRERWVKKLFQAKFQLSCGSAAASGTAVATTASALAGGELWQGSSLSHIQQFEPFALEFSPAGLKIVGNNQVALTLKRTDQADVVFDQELRNMVLLDRLAARCELVGTVQQGNQQFVLVWKAPLTGAVRFSVNKETLHLQAFCVPVSHPLEDKLARFCEAHPTDASLDLALSMLADSTLAIQAAEAHAKRNNRSIRVSASSVTNVHFMFDATLSEERMSFDCRFFGNSRLVVWNRAGWAHTSPMMGGDVNSVAGLQTVLS